MRRKKKTAQNVTLGPSHAKPHFLFLGEREREKKRKKKRKTPFLLFKRPLQNLIPTRRERQTSLSTVSALLARQPLPFRHLFLLCRRLSFNNSPHSPHTRTRTRPLTTPAMAAYATERRIAELAVQRACLLTDKVYHSRVKGTVTKGDKSPVTIADFGAQALVIGAVHTVFPHDSIVGEEDADVLRTEADKRESVWALVQSAVDDSAALTVDIGAVQDAEEMMALIDLGNHAGGSAGRIWALDPIDGTKGFLRGDQYAVCLALIVDGSVQVGALGCPNLPVDPAQPEGEKGILLSAVRGQGATIRPLSNLSATPTPISMRAISELSAATFCEGVEAGHSSHGQQAAIAAALGITNSSVKMDSQAKYATVARGVADIYLRLPTSATYQEKIWDHAAGSLIVEEAGGIVSDAHGNALNFGVGRTLSENKGVVAATRNIHAEVIAAVKAELAKAQL